MRMHQTLQIEDIVSPGGTHLFYAVDAAAALRAIGWNVRYKKQEHRSDGGRFSHAWCLDAGLGEAQSLLSRAALTSGPESLIHRTPEHPFLAALFGIRALRALMGWFANPDQPPAAVKPSPGSRLCTLNDPRSPGDLLPLVWLAEQPSDDVAITRPESAAFCAAAIAVGFLPHPHLTGPDVPHVHFPSASFTFLGLSLTDFHKPELPGTPIAGAHPFRAALHGCLRWQQCVARQEAERRKTVLIRSLSGPGVAVVSSDILDTTDPRFAKDRDKIQKHIALA